ncbi:hypothetical protein RCL1_007536 [Eukaryota sp. TZLM3-RCL]
MPVKLKNKRFNKKQSAHFQLVNRSHTDLRADDEDASAFVLKPLNESAAAALSSSIPQPSTTTLSAEERRTQNVLNFGFNDDFDYSQYLMSTGPGDGFVHVGRNTEGKVTISALDDNPSIALTDAEDSCDDVVPDDVTVNDVAMFSADVAADVAPQELLVLKEGYFNDYYEVYDVNKMDGELKEILFEEGEAEELEDDFVVSVVNLAKQVDEEIEEDEEEEVTDDEFIVDNNRCEGENVDRDLLNLQVLHELNKNEEEESEEEEEGLDVEEALKLYLESSESDVEQEEDEDYVVNKSAQKELIQRRRELDERLKNNDWSSESDVDDGIVDTVGVAHVTIETRKVLGDVETVASAFTNVYHHPEILSFDDLSGGKKKKSKPRR